MSPAQVWQLAHGRSITLDRPRLLAIINTTPDSFYEGSRAGGVGAALDHAQRAVADGADMLDIGGESTRPGAARVSAAGQIERVVPVIAAVRAAGGALREIPVSVDTTLPEVAEAALRAGADAINDVSGATEHPGAMLDLAAQAGAGLILMHRARPPETDSYSDRYDAEPAYGDVVTEIRAMLAERADAAARAGVVRESIVLDPGLGFGKSVEQNLELVRRSSELASLGFPVLSAASRKSFVGRVSLPESAQSEPRDRLAGSLAFSVEHLASGARIFRVHDVSAQRQALLSAWAIARRAD